MPSTIGSSQHRVQRVGTIRQQLATPVIHKKPIIMHSSQHLLQVVGAGHAAQGRQHRAARAHLHVKRASALQGGASVAAWDGMGGVSAPAVDGAGQESGKSKRPAGRHSNRCVQRQAAVLLGARIWPSVTQLPPAQQAQRGGCARRGWSPPGSPWRLHRKGTETVHPGRGLREPAGDEAQGAIAPALRRTRKDLHKASRLMCACGRRPAAAPALH